jgi:hypothetical protein
MTEAQRQSRVPPRQTTRHRPLMRCPHHPQSQPTTTLLRSKLPAPNNWLNPALRGSAANEIRELARTHSACACRPQSVNRLQTRNYRACPPFTFRNTRCMTRC